jgi:hypothetical protein
VLTAHRLKAVAVAAAAVVEGQWACFRADKLQSCPWEALSPTAGLLAPEEPTAGRVMAVVVPLARLVQAEPTVLRAAPQRQVEEAVPVPAAACGVVGAEAVAVAR